MSANYTPPHIPGAPTLPWLPHEIDAHPDAARIWATILAAREDTVETEQSAPRREADIDTYETQDCGEACDRIQEILEKSASQIDCATDRLIAAADALNAIFDEIDQ